MRYVTTVIVKTKIKRKTISLKTELDDICVYIDTADEFIELLSHVKINMLFKICWQAPYIYEKYVLIVSHPIKFGSFHSFLFFSYVEVTPRKLTHLRCHKTTV